MKSIMNKIKTCCLLLVATTLMSTSLEAKNLSTSLHVAADFTQYSNTNVAGGVGYEFGLRQYFYFHKSLGLFAGLDYASRHSRLNVTEKLTWLDIPFGFSFRYGNGFSEELKSTFDLGMYYSMNQKDVAADAAIGKLQGGMGLFLTSSNLFEITSSFAMGPYIAIKYGFFSPFADLDGPSMFSSNIGLETRFAF